MALKPFNIKLEEDDLARWDAVAASQGLTRTALIITAVERFISSTTEQAPPPKQAESQPAQEHKPRHGVRRAFICLHEKCMPPRRTFLPAEVAEDFVPDCPEHGRMSPQPNHPYFKQEVR